MNTLECVSDQLLISPEGAKDLSSYYDLSAYQDHLSMQVTRLEAHGGELKWITRKSVERVLYDEKRSVGSYG